MYTFSLDFVMFKQRFPNKNIFLRLSLEVWAWRVIKGKNAEEVDEGKGYNGRNVEEGKERNRKWKKEGFKGRNEIQSGNETKKEDIKGGKGRKKEWHRSKEGKGTEDTKEDRKASKEGRNPKIGKNRRKEKRRYSEDGRDAPPLPPNKYFGISKKKNSFGLDTESREHCWAGIATRSSVKNYCGLQAAAGPRLLLLIPDYTTYYPRLLPIYSTTR